jgi:hypothetical protein
MNISVRFLLQSPRVELQTPRALHDSLTSSLPAVRHFLADREMRELAERQQPGASWQLGFETFKKLIRKSSAPIRLEVEEAQEVFQLMASVCLVRSVVGLSLDPVLKTTLGLAEMVPCPLSPMILPEPEETWTERAPSEMAAVAYEHLYEELYKGSFEMPLLHAYVLFRELPRCPLDPAVLALLYQLEKATAPLHFLITEINKERSTPPSAPPENA